MFTKLKQTTEKRRKPNTAFGHRFVLTLLLLIVGAGASWGQTTYYYVLINLILYMKMVFLVQ